MHKQAKLSGFTIVELLIVIVVIAILATISIVAYRGIQDRARAAEVSAGLTQAKKKLELYKVDNGNYPTTGSLADAGVVDKDVSYQYTSDGTTYCLTGTTGTTSYKATNTTSPEQGGCAGHGQGGVDAITNLADNPSFETNTSGWVENGGMPSARTNEWASSGTYSMRANNTNGWATQIRQTVGTPAVSGESFSVTATVRAGVAAQNIYIGIDWFNAGNTQISNSNSSTVSVPINSTAVLQKSGIAPANTASARIRVVSGTLPAGNTLYVDSVMLTKSSLPYSFADGNSPNWVWNSTQNNSTSTGPVL